MRIACRFFSYGVEETINFQLRFPSGVLANCVSSYGVGLNRFRVHAEKAAFELEPALSYSDLRMRVIRGGTVESRSLPERCLRAAPRVDPSRTLHCE